MTHAVIFDMYETLVTQYNTPLYFTPQMAADAGVAETAFRAAWDPTESDRSTGVLTLEQALAHTLQACGCFSDRLVALLAGRRKAAKVDQFHHLHPEILPTLQALWARGLPIGLVSNCFSEEVEAIRGSILFPCFDAVCLSFEEGIQKPEAELFLRCARRLNVPPEECLYVGDGGGHGLEAASSLGMRAVQAVWYLREDIPSSGGRGGLSPPWPGRQICSSWPIPFDTPNQ